MKDKMYVPTQEEALEELSKIASKEVLQNCRKLFENGNKVQAIKILREYKIL